MSILAICIFLVSYLGLNKYYVVKIIEKADSIAMTNNLDAFQLNLEDFKMFSLIFPEKNEYLTIFQVQLEFLKLQSHKITDQKGALLFLQNLKLRVQKVIDNTANKSKNMDLLKKGESLLSAMTAFEGRELKRGISELQTEVLKSHVMTRLRNPAEFQSRRILRVDK